MCGITAIIGNSDTEQFKKILYKLDHRGGDNLSYSALNGGIMGISRLSITDVSGGNQPISNASGNLHIVCNGEIYNHNELRYTVANAYNFQTGSDTEVIVALYERFGPDCVQWLDGMFAFLLYDENTGEFLAARDRFGIKPLYYVEAEGSWFFASEAKAFLDCGLPIEKISYLPPGHIMTREGTRQWYSLDRQRRVNAGSAQTVRALLEESVRKHLMMDGDIKVGTFLSGGIDSSIITALAARHRPDIVAFTIGMDESPDVQAARRVAEHLGIRHIVRSFDLQEVRDLLPEAVYSMENYNQVVLLEGLMGIMLSRLAKEFDVKVVLCGEGADEIFGGYGAFRGRSPWDTTEMMRGSVKNIHNTECLRLDRSTMACALEARVPFLDPALVEYAINLPIDALIKNDGNMQVEKWILRSSCQDLLPQDLVWRSKLAFDDGSGIMNLMREVESEVSEDDLRLAQQLHPESGLNSKLGLYLFNHWKSHFGILGGRDAWQLFGHYPIMQSIIDARSADRRGTGEPEYRVPDFIGSGISSLAFSS